jgi:hypothetical protein
MHKNITTMTLAEVYKCEHIFSVRIASEQTGDRINEHNVFFFWLQCLY